MTFKRLKWQLIYITNVVLLVASFFSLIGMFILMLFTGKSPPEMFKDVKKYSEKHLKPEYRIVYNGHIYRIETRTLFSWEYIKNYGVRSESPDRGLIEKSYMDLKEESDKLFSDFKKISISTESKLWETLND